MSDLDRVLNCSWWAKALADHRDLDVTEHSGDRAHQKRDPDAHELHGPDHELSEWEAGWLRERVIDRLRDRLLARNVAADLLATDRAAHLEGELTRRAKDYFGGTHEETRAKFHALRAEHAEAHRVARDAFRSKPTPEEHAHLVEEIAQREDTLNEIESYLAMEAGLIARHIATVTVEIDEARRQAQVDIDEATLLVSVPFEELVANYTSRVQDEIRAIASSR